MAAYAQHVDAVLRDAIGSLTPDPLPRDGLGLVSNYQGWVGEQMALQHWAGALVRDLARLEWLLQQVSRPPEAPDWEDGSLPLEEAFWRVDAASEKISTLLTIALGQPALTVEENRLCFRPNLDPARKKMLSAVRKLAKVDDQVRRLMGVYNDLEAAREYRNQVSHSLSAITNTYLAPFVGVYMDRDLKVLDTRRHYVPPLGVFVPGEDIQAQTLLARALRVADEALNLLHEGAELCAHVIRKHGRLGAGVTVYFVGGRAQLVDPRKPPI